MNHPSGYLITLWYWVSLIKQRKVVIFGATSHNDVASPDGEAFTVPPILILRFSWRDEVKSSHKVVKWSSLVFFSENLKTVANFYWEAVFYIFFMQKNSKYTSLSLLLLSDIKAGICGQKTHFVAFLFQVIIILQVIIIQLHHLIELLLQSKCLSDL